METFASTAVWEDDGRLTVYDKTQGAPNCHEYLCSVFGLAKDKVRVLSPYVGGAFGVGLRPNYQLFMAALAAIGLKRSVQSRADAAADVHAWLSSANTPDANAGSRQRRTIGGREA